MARPETGTAKSKSRSEEHTSELQSRQYLVCRLLLEKKKNQCDSSDKHDHATYNHEVVRYLALRQDTKTPHSCVVTLSVRVSWHICRQRMSLTSKLA